MRLSIDNNFHKITIFLIFDFFVIESYIMMVDPEKRLEEMISSLRGNNYRITPQRVAILKVLAASRRHPSVDKIYEKVKATFPTTSLATVYKNITILAGLGEVLELGFGHESSRYDGNQPHPHPHLVCTGCKKIIDPDLESLKDVTQELTKETGFKILSHRLDFFGLCPACQKRSV